MPALAVFHQMYRTQSLFLTAAAYNEVFMLIMMMREWHKIKVSPMKKES